MRKAFIELAPFTRWVSGFMSDEEFSDVQYALMLNPDAGEVIPGCRGLRKLRVGDRRRGKGRRGGGRIVYLHIPEVDWIFLIAGYGKDQQQDLAPDEKKFLATLVKELRELAIAVGHGMET